MRLSLVVPCYNEAGILAEFHAHVVGVVADLVPDYELVYVDDGSSDKTRDLIVSLADCDPHVRYVSFSRNFGKESAMLAGLAYATGDAVVVMDADLQHPPTLIEQMLDRYEHGFDQVMARRTRQGDPARRTFTARLYYWMVNRLVDVELVDGIGDFRLLSRRAVDALLTLGEYNRFSKGLFAWIGFPQAVVDYENVERSGGESKWTLRRLLNYGIDGVLSFNDKPLRMAIYLGGFITAGSFGYVVWLVIAASLRGIAVPGYITLITAVMFLGGVQLVFLGVVGEYVGRIYYESKRRPHYIVQETNSGQPQGRAG